MTKDYKLASDTELYAQIERLTMTESERMTAKSALGTADVLVDSMVWINNLFTRLFAGAASKPGFKHKIAA